MAMNLDAILRIKAKVGGIGEVRNLQDSLKGVEDSAREATKELKATSESGNWKDSALRVGATAVSLGLMAKSAIDFESSMADVRKVVSGLDTPAGLTNIKNEILELTRSMPITAQGFTEIYAAAGASGIARDQLRQFAILVAKVSTAFDMTAQEAGMSLSQMSVALGLTTKEVEALADAMNYVSDSTGASAAGLVEFMTRAGATGKLAGLSGQETMAFGAAMQQTGIQSEVAATSFNNMIKALSAGSGMTERQVSALNALGYAFGPAIVAEKDYTQEAEAQSRARIATAERETEDLSREIDNRYRRIKKQLQDQWEDERDSREDALAAASEKENKALQRDHSKRLQQIDDNYADQESMELSRLSQRYDALSENRSKQEQDQLRQQQRIESESIRRRYRDMREIEVAALEDNYENKKSILREKHEDELKLYRRAARDREEAIINALDKQQKRETGVVKDRQKALEESERVKIDIVKEKQKELEATQKKQAEAAADAWKQSFAERLQKEGSGFIVEILSRISKLPKSQQVSIMRDLFGDEARGLAPMISNIDELTRVLKLATDQQNYSGSVTREYGIRSQTTANQLTLLNNSVNELKIGLGEALLPVLQDVAAVITPLIQAFAGIVKAVGGFITEFARIAAIESILGLAMGPLVAFASLLGGVFSLITLTRWAAGLKILAVLPTPLRLIAAAFGILLAAASPLGPIINAIVIGLTAIQALNFAKNVIESFSAFGPAIVSAAAAFSSFVTFLTGTILPALVAFFSGPAGWVTLAVIAVTGMAVTFREPIGQFFQWLVSSTSEFMTGVWTVIDEILIKPFVNFWSQTLPEAATAAGTLLVNKWQSLTKAFNDLLIAPIANAWKGIMEFVPSAMSSAATAVSNIWSSIATGIASAFQSVINAIRNSINSVAGSVNNLISGFNNLPGPDLPYVPTFAKGGYVKGPTLAMIGEGGEGESVVPDSKRFAFARNVLSGVTGAAAIPQFASGGYVSGRDFNRSLDAPGVNAANRANSQRAAQSGRIHVTAGTRINGMSARDWFSSANQWSLRFRSEGGRSGGSVSRPVMVSIKPQMVQVPGMTEPVATMSEVERMAWDIASQVVNRNNEKQRQPSATRRSGKR